MISHNIFFFVILRKNNLVYYIINIFIIELIIHNYNIIGIMHYAFVNIFQII